VFEKGGARVVCDTVSLGFLRGAVVEYEDSLMRSAFQVRMTNNNNHN
jgi:Fe-S cluster assembly iron-binding protein IscA